MYFPPKGNVSVFPGSPSSSSSRANRSPNPVPSTPCPKTPLPNQSPPCRMALAPRTGHCSRLHTGPRRLATLFPRPLSRDHQGPRSQPLSVTFKLLVTALPSCLPPACPLSSPVQPHTTVPFSEALCLEHLLARPSRAQSPAREISQQQKFTHCPLVPGPLQC